MSAVLGPRSQSNTANFEPVTWPLYNPVIIQKDKNKLMGVCFLCILENAIPLEH